MVDQIYNLYIGAIGVVAGIAVPIVIYYLQKKKKSLIFEKIQDISMININDDFKDKIEIKYADKSVNNLFVLTAKIINNGTLPIKKNDIISPIKITFQEKFIECIVTEVNPPGVEVNLNINRDENSVECRFNLLNPFDYFTLQFVSLEQLSIPTIVSRIDGLSKVNTTTNELSFIHGSLSLFEVLKRMEYKRPLSYFSVPGLIMASTGFLMGLKFLQDYYLGGSLRFGPTLFMVLMTILGAFMVFTGIIVDVLSKSINDSIKHN